MGKTALKKNSEEFLNQEVYVEPNLDRLTGKTRLNVYDLIKKQKTQANNDKRKSLLVVLAAASIAVVVLFILNF